METHNPSITNPCSFAGLRPFMADLPYPPIQVREQNLSYASLLSIDYCGFVSELSAITQYVNNENRLSAQSCPIAKTLLGIAMAEMMHLQKLGELIVLLGGNITFTAHYRNGGQKMWSPQCLTLPEHAAQMITADIEAEKAAIRQYETHIGMIKDDCVNDVLKRIIQDETYHIMLLHSLQSQV